MNTGTESIHRSLVTLGERLGFVVEREVSTSLLAVKGEYAPRIDLMWSLAIDSAKREAIAEATGRDLREVTHLPVVGIEVEGTDPTTKILASDAANIRALGAPLGLLVVSDESSRGIYRRAARTIRTMRRNLGEMSVVPVDASWIPELLQAEWDSTAAEVPGSVAKKPRGGETKAWAAHARKRLRALGAAAGFDVAEPLVPRDVQVRFEAERQKRREAMRHTWDPLVGEQREVSKAGDYLTECEIDLAWLLPLPRALEALLSVLAERDPCMRAHDLVYPELWQYVPVVGFELESAAGKHAGGGLINLAAYCVMGLALTPDEATAKCVRGALATYQPTLGLRNVDVRVLP